MQKRHELSRPTCKSTRTVRKQIKYRVTSEDISTLAGIQKKILKSAGRYVRPGGKLIYSTCTLSPAENEDQTAGFIAKDPGFYISDEKLFVPGREGCGSDGFYICVMKKTLQI